MKRKISILLLSFLCVLCAFGQEGNDSILPLLTRDKIWTKAICSDGSYIPYTTQSYKVWKDTLIDGENYSIIIQTKYGTEEWDTIYYKQLYREDKCKIYSQGIIFYDFTMKPGDSLVYDDQQNKVILDSIVSQKMVNGQMRDCFYVSYYYKEKYYKTFTWIEGVGSTLGLDQPFYDNGESNGIGYLLCVHENGEQIYQSPHYNWCSVYPIDPLVKEGTQWNIGIATQSNNHSDTNSFSYLIRGDTSIWVTVEGGFWLATLKKLYKISGDSSKPPIYAGGLYGTRSVSFLSPEKTSMDLIYNFNLREGDSFIAPDGQDTLHVDSLLYKPFAGRERLHWYMHSLVNPGSPQTLWVEDIGRLGDILQSTNSSETDTIQSFLLCFSENGEQVYQNPKYNSCNLNYSSVPLLENQKQLISLFSIDNGLLRLQVKSNISGEIILYTLDGKQVLRKAVSGKESTIHAPAGGLLIYRFVTEKGEVQTGKVVVQ